MAGAREKPVRIGLIGAGAIMRLSHAPTIQRSDEAVLAAVYDVDSARAAALAAEFGVPRHTSELAALVEGNGHRRGDRRHAERLSSRGGDRRGRGRQARALREAARDRHRRARRRWSRPAPGPGVVLQVGFNQRCWSQVEIAKSLIDSGFIGKVHGFRTDQCRALGRATRRRRAIATISPSRAGRRSSISPSTASISPGISSATSPRSGRARPIARRRTRSTTMSGCSPASSRARGAALSSDRYSPAIGDGTDIYGSEGTIHIATETVNPFHATPLAVYTDKPAESCPTCCARRTIPTPGGRPSRAAGSACKPPRRNPYDKQLAGFIEAIRTGKTSLDLRRRRPARRRRSSRPRICRCATGAGSTCRCPKMRHSSCRPILRLRHWRPSKERAIPVYRAQRNGSATLARKGGKMSSDIHAGRDRRFVDKTIGRRHGASRGRPHLPRRGARRRHR